MSKEVMSNTIDEYTCAECGQTFEKGWSNEEADIEKQALWGDLEPDKSAVICDDCFEELFPKAYGTEH